jgi:RNA polymerase sigma-70 factor (ECF subfamily)|tara:strand:+ start:246 stop:827 length:582 start_codon:yes stop_codon:yes gene_type:complete
MSAIAERKKTSSEAKENKVAFKVAKKTLKQEDQELSFEVLLKEIPKKLMGYAMVLAKNNKDDAWDLIQTTVLKLIEKKKVFMKVKYKTSFTKVILRNAFIDKYRKDKRMVSIEENSIQLIEPGKFEEARESEEMLTFLESMNDEDQIILAMLALGHSYQEIQEVLGPISIGNLRVKANRARIRLAESMEREHE